MANINVHKYYALHRIDDEAAKCRRKYITVIHGQESVYSAKLTEATNFINGIKEPMYYLPLISQELSIPIFDLADSIIKANTNWETILSPKIEALRTKYKYLVRNSDSIEEIDKLALEAQEGLHSI